MVCDFTVPVIARYVYGYPFRAHVPLVFVAVKPRKRSRKFIERRFVYGVGENEIRLFLIHIAPEICAVREPHGYFVFAYIGKSKRARRVAVALFSRIILVFGSDRRSDILRTVVVRMRHLRDSHDLGIEEIERNGLRLRARYGIALRVVFERIHAAVPVRKINGRYGYLFYVHIFGVFADDFLARFGILCEYRTAAAVVYEPFGALVLYSAAVAVYRGISAAVKRCPAAGIHYRYGKVVRIELGISVHGKRRIALNYRDRQRLRRLYLEFVFDGIRFARIGIRVFYGEFLFESLGHARDGRSERPFDNKLAGSELSRRPGCIGEFNGHILFYTHRLSIRIDIARISEPRDFELSARFRGSAGTASAKERAENDACRKRGNKYRDKEHRSYDTLS